LSGGYSLELSTWDGAAQPSKELVLVGIRFPRNGVLEQGKVIGASVQFVRAFAGDAPKAYPAHCS
jgi:hypothetical protein